ncbi:oxidoreductase [Pseudoxanthomonas wuyuanensis]|nr:oxidoreductase [Pseudoxanthomonas wuyuanensis]KAF1723212.1 oxidoreductase [Pseudoxanthomonas wuyuanensis]
MKTLQVALIGYGFVGKVFHAPLIAHTEGLNLHTVVSRQPDVVAAAFPQVRIVAEADAAFADPAVDLVVIAAPNSAHAPLAEAALRHGKHVVVDKPFTVTLAEAQSVLAHAERSGRVLSVFQNRRWDADFLTVRKLIASGRLGEVAEFHSHFDRFRPRVADRWRERDEPGGGLWFDLGPHLLDQALQLFGMPQAIFADLAQQRAAAKTVDYFNVLLRYPRRRVVLHAGSLVPASGLRFAVHGTRGSYLKHGLDGQEDRLRAGGMPGEPGWGTDTQPGQLTVDEGGTLRTGSVASVPGDYREYYRGMRAAIMDGRPPPVTPQEALEVMGLIEMGIQSSLERREIAL